jgi:hypothetical protein
MDLKELHMYIITNLNVSFVLKLRAKLILKIDSMCETRYVKGDIMQNIGKLLFYNIFCHLPGTLENGLGVTKSALIGA